MVLSAVGSEFGRDAQVAVGAVGFVVHLAYSRGSPDSQADTDRSAPTSPMWAPHKHPIQGVPIPECTISGLPGRPDPHLPRLPRPPPGRTPSRGIPGAHRAGVARLPAALRVAQGFPGDLRAPLRTPCKREHACIRCPVLQMDPNQRPRLIEIIQNLRERITEARGNGWLGEVEGLQVSFDAAMGKLNSLKRAQPMADRSWLTSACLSSPTTAHIPDIRGRHALEAQPTEPQSRRGLVRRRGRIGSVKTGPAGVSRCTRVLLAMSACE